MSRLAFETYLTRFYVHDMLIKRSMAIPGVEGKRLELLVAVSGFDHWLRLRTCGICISGGESR